MSAPRRPRSRWSAPDRRACPRRTRSPSGASTFACSRRARPGAGQSAGRTRIFRHAHRRSELVRRAAESRAIWEEWQERLGVQLLGRQGVMVTGAHAPDARGAAGGARACPRACSTRPSRQRAAADPAARRRRPRVLDELAGPTDVRAAIAALAAALGDRLIARPGVPRRARRAGGAWRPPRGSGTARAGGALRRRGHRRAGAGCRASTSR